MSSISEDQDDAPVRRLAEARLRAAAAGEREAQEVLSAATELLESEIDTARSLGIAWAAIAANTGLSESQAQWRLHRDDPSVRENRQRVLIPESERKSRSGPRPGRGPGMSVTEFARMCGVTRRTVYNWIEERRIESTRNELGQTRILDTADPRAL